MSNFYTEMMDEFAPTSYVEVEGKAIRASQAGGTVVSNHNNVEWTKCFCSNVASHKEFIKLKKFNSSYYGRLLNWFKRF